MSKTYTEWAPWMVTLWIENDFESYTAWGERIKELREEAPDADQVMEEIWKEDEYVRITLAEELKEWIENSVKELALSAGILSEYLEAGIEWTDWHIVARNLIGE